MKFGNALVKRGSKFSLLYLLELTINPLSTGRIKRCI